jgi:O-antigen ligase
MNVLSDPWLLLLLAFAVLVVSLIRYERWAVPLVLLTSFWGGMAVAYQSTFLSLRWGALALAAAGGVLLWLQNRRRLRFSAIHLLTFWTAVNVIFSAAISVNATMTLLKGTTVLVLLVFATIGVRLVFTGREMQVRRMWLLAAEVITWVGGICHWVIDQRIFGHPNSFGAIFAILVVPILIWSAIANPSISARRRAWVTLIAAAAMLTATSARAAYLSAAMGAVVMLYVLRRDKLMVPALALAAFCLAFVATSYPEIWEGITDAIYKKREGSQSDDLLESRRAGWQESFEGIAAHPWVGIGFGVTPGLSDQWEVGASGSGYDRERGNSYLAIVEGIGIFGSLPFVAMLVLLIRRLWRGARGFRRAQDTADIAIPLAAAITAGLVHAVFEGWLFSAGYYITVVFWVFTFWFVDREAVVTAARGRQRPMRQWRAVA